LAARHVLRDSLPHGTCRRERGRRRRSQRLPGQKKSRLASTTIAARLATTMPTGRNDRVTADGWLLGKEGFAG
jgi:hypothetical protein